MTGCYSLRTGLHSAIICGAANPLKTGQTVLGEMLKSQEYPIATAAERHLGDGEQRWPTRPGFNAYRVGAPDTIDGPFYRDEARQRGRGRGCDRG